MALESSLRGTAAPRLGNESKAWIFIFQLAPRRCGATWDRIHKIHHLASYCCSFITIYQCCPNVESEICRKRLRMLDLDMKRSEIDLNSRLLYCHSEAAKGVVHEQWPNDFCSGDGFSSLDGILSLRGPLPGRLQSAELLLLGSVSLFGLRATHRARKPARYRSVSALAAVEALSSGFSRPHLSQHAGARQRNARLAHLRRFRAGAHRPGSRIVSRVTVRCGVGRNHLCAGFHHHRFVFGDVSLGAVPSPQECGQSAHS